MVVAECKSGKESPAELTLELSLDSVRGDRGDRRHLNIPTKEACAAWERSLRPGQYFSERGGNRPMRHRTQAVQGHPGARSWPRGPDGGAWGPQHLSPIPSERSYAPLVPSPTTSPGKRARRTEASGFSSASAGDSAGFGFSHVPSDAEAVACSIAAELGLEGGDRDALRPFQPILLQEENIPLPPPSAPITATWRPTPPGFDMRTLRRQASNLRADAAGALGDQEAVRRSSLQLAEILSATVENGLENMGSARARLGRLHEAFHRLRAERREHAEAVRAIAGWQESAEELRDKLKSSAERLRRADRAKLDAQRALDAAFSANREAEADVAHLESALEEAQHRDVVAAEIEREARLEEMADAFRRRPRPRNPGGYAALVCEQIQGIAGNACGTRGQRWIGGRPLGMTQSRSSTASEESTSEGMPNLECRSPLLFPTMSWGFLVFAEACRRSRGMRALEEARTRRAEAEEQQLLRGMFAAWQLSVALSRGEQSARQRRAVEIVTLCLARWRFFAALERRARVERERRLCLRVMEAWRGLVADRRWERESYRKLGVLLLRRSFRAWRVLRARSTLTPMENLERCRTADLYRLRRLFEAWHMSALASIASHTALVSTFQRRRDAKTMADDFRAWASLSRARRWYRVRRLESGLWHFARGFCQELGGASRLEPLVHRRRQGEVTKAMRSAFYTSSSRWTLRKFAERRLRKARERARDHLRRRVLLKGFQCLLSATSVIRRRAETRIGTLRARTALLSWRGAVRSHRRVQAGITLAGDATTRLCLRRTVRAWRHRALARASRRSRRRVRVLRKAFHALRQGCLFSRNERSSGCAMLSMLRRRRASVVRQAFERLRAGTSENRRLRVSAEAALRGRAAQRRREREGLEAAWRWWVRGWLQRQRQRARVRGLEAKREMARARELSEQLRQVQEASAGLSGEAVAVNAEIKKAKIDVSGQENALAESKESLKAVRDDTAALKARLGKDSRGRTAGDRRRDKRGRADTGSPGMERAAVSYAGRGSPAVASDEDRRIRNRRLARKRGALHVVSAAEQRRREAEERAVATEEATARICEVVDREEHARKEVLKEARDTARHRRDKLEREEARIREVEQKKKRMKAEVARLLEKVNGLERRAEAEATQKGARVTSGGESERAALTLEVSTTEAKWREQMAIVEERGKEVAELKQALTAKECRRQEEAFGIAESKDVNATGIASTPGGATFRSKPSHAPDIGRLGVIEMQRDKGLPPGSSMHRSKVNRGGAVPEATASPQPRAGARSSSGEGREERPRSKTPLPTTPTFFKELDESISALRGKMSSRMLLSPSSPSRRRGIPP